MKKARGDKMNRYKKFLSYFIIGGVAWLCFGIFFNISISAQDISATNASTHISGDKWRWTIFIDASPQTLGKIKCVEYRLLPTFSNPVRKVCEKGPENRAFALSGVSWGEFEVPIQVFLKNKQIQELKYHLKFGAGIAKEKLKHEELEKAIEKKVKEVTKKRVKKSLEQTVKEAIEEKVEEAVEKKIKEAIEEKVEEAVEKKIKEAIEEKVEKAVEKKIKEAIEEKVEEAVEKKVKEKEIEKAIEEKVSEAKEVGLEEAVEKKIKEAIEEKVEKAVEKKVKESGTGLNK